MSRKAAIHNLGCKVNSYESDVMAQELREDGYEIVSFNDYADVYIVNTCTVTSIADRKSRQMLHRARMLNPDALVVAAGCYAETGRETLEQDPAVDLCLDNHQKGRIAGILRQIVEGNTPRDTLLRQMAEGNDYRDVLQQEADPPGGSVKAGTTGHGTEIYEPLRLSRPGRTRADVKIQDGCNQFCSYCIIPYARGRIRSRDPEEVVLEAKKLAATGTAEIVLTGIHVSSYRKELGLDPQEELLSLLRRLQLIAGLRRIRLSSLEPRLMSARFVEGIRGLSKVCPHFHLSLQSGCDETLRRMNRHYSTVQYRESVRLLREAFDRPAITTDIIVGFPGETAEEFEQTMALVREIRFYEVHVFKYSARKGTAAASFPNPCTDQQKKQRSAALLELTHRQARVFRESFLGQDEELLLEERIELESGAFYTGHTSRYVEGLVAAAEGMRPGTFVRGRFCDGPDERGRMRMEQFSFGEK